MSSTPPLVRPPVVLLTLGLAAVLLLALPGAARATPEAVGVAPTARAASDGAAPQGTRPAGTLPDGTLPDGTTATLGPVAPGAPQGLVVRPSAMWLWTWTNSAAVVQYALANNVTQIFAYTAPGFTRAGYIPPGWTVPMLPIVTDLSARARLAGIRVDAMGGDPSWVFNPPIAGAWADESLRTGLFTGLHVDIEPWVLPQWPSQTGPLSNGLLLSLDQVRAAAPGRQIEVSLPFWAWQFVTSDGTRLDTAIMVRADAVSIITYRDTVAGIHDIAITPSLRAMALDKPFRWAAETNNVQPPEVTFFGRTNIQMLAVLDEAERIATSVPLYRGYAFHDYTGWSAMRR